MVCSSRRGPLYRPAYEITDTRLRLEPESQRSEAWKLPQCAAAEQDLLRQLIMISHSLAQTFFSMISGMALPPWANDRNADGGRCRDENIAPCSSQGSHGSHGSFGFWGRLGLGPTWELPDWAEAARRALSLSNSFLFLR